MTNINLKAETAEELLNLIPYLKNFSRKLKFEELNNYLKSIDLKECSILVIIALLRSNYSVAKYLDCYSDLLNRAHIELQSRGENSHSILRGLDNFQTFKPVLLKTVVDSEGNNYTVSIFD